MKKTNTWFTIIAVVILGLVGMYLLNKNKSPEIVTYLEVIDGEEVTLDYPLVESFSNPESNKQADVTSTNSSKILATVNHVVETVKKPFILGFYYVDNFKDFDLQPCQSLNGSKVRDAEFPEYNVDNFKLTDVSFENNSAYLYVEADEIPKKICAQILQFNKLTNTLFDAIHVVINKS